jgi:hypothetical protein
MLPFSAEGGMISLESSTRRVVAVFWDSMTLFNNMLQEAGILVLQENHCDIGHPIAASSTASLFEVIHQQHEFDKIKLMLMRRREEEYPKERARMLKRHTALSFLAVRRISPE